MLYEAMLIFGVLFASVWVFSTLLEQRHALYLRNALQDWLFLVMGCYFVWFWSRGGQTLAMKTWRVRVETRTGQTLRPRHAILRYLLSWMWILPGLALAWALGAKNWMLLLIPAANVILWALTAVVDPERQFLHDRIAGTRIVSADGPK